MLSSRRGETLLVTMNVANKFVGDDAWHRPAAPVFQIPTNKIIGRYRIILSADTASEVRQLLSQKRR